MRIAAALALPVSFLFSCASMDPGHSDDPVGPLAFRLVDADGNLKPLAAKTCSLAVSFRSGEISQDSVLDFADGRWLSPSMPSSQDWRISLVGIDSTGHRIWSGSASGTFGGKEMVGASLWTDVPVQAVSAMASPSLSLVSGSYDLPLKLSRGAGTEGRLSWSGDSLHWIPLAAGGVNIDSAMTLWTRLEDTGIRPRLASLAQKLEILAKKVDRPVYAGTVTGVDFPLTFALDSVAGTTLHWSLDTGRTWSEGRQIPMAVPGLLRAFGTRPHQPGSDTLTLSLDGTVTPRTMTDARDGKVYKVVRIGKQVWMAQNLDYVTDSSWAVPTSDCAIGTAPAGCTSLLGRYYSWSAAMALPPEADTAISVSISGKDICPSGWHLPSPNEWDALKQTIGNGAVEDLAVYWPGSLAAYTGNDSWGFSAYPVAFRSLNGGSGLFVEAEFWSNEPQAVGMASAWGWPPYATLGTTSFYRRSGLPVRCLRDEP